MTKNQKLLKWVHEMAELCQPENIHWCDGSEEEYQKMTQLLVEQGTFIKLNEKKKPGSFYARSEPSDVARVEDRTYVCWPTKEESGPNNNWKDPKEMKEILLNLFRGSMRGRTMYVIPYSMGPIGSEISKIGVEITDSPYVVVNMRIMTRIGKKVLEVLGDDFFVPGLHSVGYPLNPGQKDVPWPCNHTKYIVHFPEDKSIWSYGSGYGGNALLGKKCYALRIASILAREEGWLAEHMLIVGVTSPEGEKKYIAAAFPSASGKTNFAMLESALPGWKVETVGDDIAWMKFGSDGRLYAINPEYGFFGVAPGTSLKTNPNAILTLQKNSIFTNVALTEDLDVWWEGLTDEKPNKLINWKGEEWTPDKNEPASHPNARFTTPASQCPVMDPDWENPNGVPISAIIFGGRRSSFIPLVFQTFDWTHGVFTGSIQSSETTAAAAGEVGKLRFDPFAMLPFCGYNMADYFAHWLSFKHRTDENNLPKIFVVNWFRKDENGKFIWPGYGENIRVVKWIFERLNDKENYETSPLGFIPKFNSLDVSGLNIPENRLRKLFEINKEEGLTEYERVKEFYNTFNNKIPKELWDELEKMKMRFESM